jgi:glycosyltransferase involved in cell wall biosynthesis
VVGDTAVMVQPGDPEELAAALRDLLDSPQRRAQLGEAAWRRVQERFAWPAVARATVAEYERAIAARRAGAGPVARTDGPPPADGTSLKGAGHC